MCTYIIAIKHKIKQNFRVLRFITGNLKMFAIAIFRSYGGAFAPDAHTPCILRLATHIDWERFFDRLFALDLSISL